MVEEEFVFEFKGKKHEWRLVHNLDEYDLNLPDAFLNFAERFQEKVDDIDMFCGYIRSKKGILPDIMCMPATVFYESLGK